MSRRRPNPNPRVEAHEQGVAELARRVVNQEGGILRDPSIPPPPVPPPPPMPATVHPTWPQGPVLDAAHAEAVAIAHENFWRR